MWIEDFNKALEIWHQKRKEVEHSFKKLKEAKRELELSHLKIGKPIDKVMYDFYIRGKIAPVRGFLVFSGIPDGTQFYIQMPDGKRSFIKLEEIEKIKPV